MVTLGMGYCFPGLALAVAVHWYGRRRDRAELFKELLYGRPSHENLQNPYHKHYENLCMY